MSARPTTTCRSCTAVTMWAKTPAGNSMLLDAEPVADGNVVLEGGLARVVGPPSEGELDLSPRYRPHWASCPDAQKWRKRTGAAR